MKNRDSVYEQVVTTLLLLGVVALSWLPYLSAALTENFIGRALLPINIAICLLTMALVYDASGRLSSHGKGIYAALVFCTLPATGVVTANPGALGLNAVTAMAAFTMWAGVRGSIARQAWLLVVMPFVLLYAGIICGPRIMSLAFVPAIGYAIIGKPDLLKRGMLLAGTLGLGVILRWLGFVDWLPELGIPSLAMTGSEAALVWLPWGAWAIPALRDWKRDMRFTLCAITVIGSLALAAGNPTALAAAAVGLAPVISLISADYFLRTFSQRSERAALGSGWAYIVFFAVVALCVAEVLVSSRGVVLSLMGILLAAGAIATYFLRLPRWSFALLATSALWIGTVIRHRTAVTDSPPVLTPVPPIYLIAAVLTLSVLAAVIWKRMYGAPIPRSAMREGSDQQFGGLEFRTYDARAAWSGSITSLNLPEEKSYRFAIFGDIAGADSAVSGRQSGYWVYRQLARALSAQQPSFAIALGDLSLKAGELSYRRVRQLLRKLPVPLAVTPGNHDLFDEEQYDARLFHALYGADNRSFTIGAVNFVILNNAFGSLRPEQFDWLERTLDQFNSGITLALCHKPVFDPRDGVFYGMENREDAEQLHALFVKTGVKAVFSGHIHTLLSTERDGVRYVISGGGGSKPVSREDRFHYWIADVTGDKMVLRALPILSSDNAAPLMGFSLSV